MVGRSETRAHFQIVHWGNHFPKNSRGLLRFVRPTTVAVYLMVQVAPAMLAAECVEATPRQALRAAAIVFRGKVIRTESEEQLVPMDRSTGKLPLKKAKSGDPYVATFAVGTVWKGPLDRTIQVFAFGRPSMGYGFRFRVGVEYVVYALGQIGNESAGIRQFSRRPRRYTLGFPCLLRIGTDVAKDSRALGPGKKVR